MLGLTAVSGTTVFEYLCGDITTSKELVATTTYIMKCQTFVKTGATLTIPAGTLIYAMPVGPTATAAPALIIEKGTSRARRFHRSHDAPAHLLSHRCLLNDRTPLAHVQNQTRRHDRCAWNLGGADHLHGL